MFRGPSGFGTPRAISFSARGRLRLVISQVATEHRDRHRSQGPGARAETRGWLPASSMRWAMARHLKRLTWVAAVVLSRRGPLVPPGKLTSNRELQQLKGSMNRSHGWDINPFP